MISTFRQTMMQGSSMTKRNMNIAKQAKERDGVCQRCWKGGSLHAHHIHAFADGGPDTLENLITLCSDCHRDWHHIGEDCTDFDWFLDTPTSRMLQFFALKEEMESVTFGELRRMFPLQRMMNAGINVGLSDDGIFMLGGKPSIPPSNTIH